MHPVIKLYQQLITEIQGNINNFQENCEHPDETLFKVMGASTGNWDRGDDSYWAWFWCSVCDKYWRADSEKHSEEYRFKGTKVDKFPVDKS